MKRIKSEKGAITIIVLVSMLFFVAFLISTYVVVANKVQSQKEAIEETKRIYEPKQTMAEVYNSYFGNDAVIPIYNVEQLLAVGSGRNINVNGKIYTFSNTAQTAYVLMNDLSFSAVDMDLQTDWQPFGNNPSFLGNFEGNNYSITVTNLDGTEHIYNRNNQFGGDCLLTFSITPDDATVYIEVNGVEYQVQETNVENNILSFTLELPYNSTVEYTFTKGLIVGNDTISLKENTDLEINLEANNE